FRLTFPPLPASAVFPYTTLFRSDADDLVADNFVAAMAQSLEAHDFVACGLEEHRLNEPWLTESWANGQRDGLLGFWPRFLPFGRSEEHTSELQSRENLVCRLLLE